MSITKGRIFFLGAGFSAGAGVPLTNTLLPKASQLFSYEANGLFQRVCDYANQVDVDLMGAPNAEDFAKLCTHLEFIELREYAGGERWSEDGSREKLALKFFLSKAIALNTPEDDSIPDCYLEFARSLTSDDIIVTFNWDLLLEKAIKKSGGEYCYNYEEGKIHIVKLHGSINWINNEPRAMNRRKLDFNYRPLDFKDGLMENEVYSSDELHQKHQWETAQSLVDQVKPLIVLPGYGKAFDVRLLSILWYRLEFLNIRSGGVSIIGLNVSEDDFIVESLFRYLFRGVFSNDKTINIINPDPNVKDRFLEFSDGNEINFVEDRFSSNTLDSALLIE